MEIIKVIISKLEEEYKELTKRIRELDDKKSDAYVVNAVVDKRRGITKAISIIEGLQKSDSESDNISKCDNCNDTIDSFTGLCNEGCKRTVLCRNFQSNHKTGWLNCTNCGGKHKDHIAT